MAVLSDLTRGALNSPSYYFLTLPLEPRLDLPLEDAPLDLEDEPDLDTVDRMPPVLLTRPELPLRRLDGILRIVLFFSWLFRITVLPYLEG